MQMANTVGANPTMSKDEFRQLCNRVTNTPQGQNYFIEDELSLCMGAIAFRPSHDNKVSMQEMDYWLKDGPLMLV